MTIGIDIDDVLNNLTESVLTIYRQDTGHQLFAKDITDYNMNLFIRKEYQKTFYKYFSDKRVWEIIQPIYEGFDCVNDLVEQGHTVYFVTATHPLNIGFKYEWLKKYCVFDPWRNIIVTQKKNLMHLDIMVDDCAQNMIAQSAQCYLMRKPWNESWTDIIDAIPVHNWDELRYKFEKGGLL